MYCISMPVGGLRSEFYLQPLVVKINNRLRIAKSKVQFLNNCRKDDIFIL